MLPRKDVGGVSSHHAKCQAPGEDPEEKLNKCDKVDENISSPTEKNVPRTKNDSTKDKNFFRRIAGVSDEVGKLPICFRSQKHYLGSLNTSQYQYKQFII